MSDEKLLGEDQQSVPPEKQTPPTPEKQNQAPQSKLEPKRKLSFGDDDELSINDRIENTLVGATAGLIVGGGIVASGGIIGSFAVSSGTTVIKLFGLTGAQTFAWGAIVYDVGAIIAGTFGISVEYIECEPIS